MSTPAAWPPVPLARRPSCPSAPEHEPYAHTCSMASRAPRPQSTNRTCTPAAWPSGPAYSAGARRCSCCCRQTHAARSKSPPPQTPRRRCRCPPARPRSAACAAAAAGAGAGAPSRTRPAVGRVLWGGCTVPNTSPTRTSGRRM
eukprot:364507-Chlamydomonas_euryale.AAC.13